MAPPPPPSSSSGPDTGATLAPVSNSGYTWTSVFTRLNKRLPNRAFHGPLKFYSGCDISAQVVFDNKRYEIYNLQTISISSHVARIPVRPLGSLGPTGFATGSSTFAGSLVVLLDRADIFIPLMGVDNSEKVLLLPYQLPPFDVHITFTNEYDEEYSVAHIWGIRITDMGYTASVNDLVTEAVYQYMAQSITLTQPVHSSTSSEPVLPYPSGTLPLNDYPFRFYDLKKDQIAKLDHDIVVISSGVISNWLGNTSIRSSYPVYGDYLQSGDWIISGVMIWSNVSNGEFKGLHSQLWKTDVTREDYVAILNRRKIVSASIDESAKLAGYILGAGVR